MLNTFFFSAGGGLRMCVCVCVWGGGVGILIPTRL